MKDSFSNKNGKNKKLRRQVAKREALVSMKNEIKKHQKSINLEDDKVCWKIKRYKYCQNLTTWVTLTLLGKTTPSGKVDVFEKSSSDSFSKASNIK